MGTILKQIRNEWNSNLFLFMELLLVFVVLWYIVNSQLLQLWLPAQMEKQLSEMRKN